MNILVIVKRIDMSSNSSTNKAIDISDYMAVEMAVNIKQKFILESINVSALCIAPVESSEVLRDCFSLGVDDGYLLSDPIFEKLDFDGLISTLYKSIKKIGNVDLVIMSAHSNDQVLTTIGKKLSELLNFKHYVNVENLSKFENKIAVKLKKNSDPVSLNFPSILNVSCETEQKIYNVPKIMRLFKKEVKIWDSKEFDNV